MPFLAKKYNRLVGQAMHSYRMLEEGDKILIGVSGGVDSLVLAWLLQYWRQKAPINYDLLAIHLDMGFDQKSHRGVERELKRLEVPFRIEQTTYGIDTLQNIEKQNGCYRCASQRRNHLFRLAKEENFTKVALGHHKDDIIETFFLNMLYSGNISTMVPRQDLFSGNLAIIRPLSFLEKSHVIRIADKVNLTPVKNPCPMAEHSKREEIRGLLDSLFARNPHFRSNIFAALSNVRQEYLLWK